MTDTALQETANLLRNNFELHEPAYLNNEEQLVNLLLPIIQQLLNRDFEKLLQVCYRVDLDENKLKEILHKSPPGQIAGDLSKAIVNRQLQKVEIRRLYSSNDG
jgi:hypothetical protein